MALDPDTARLVARLARRVANVEKAQKRATRTSQGRHRSIDGGYLPIYDDDGVLRQVIGEQTDGSFTITDQNGAPPPTPDEPLVVSTPGVLVASSYGLTDDGTEWPLDLARIDVHVGTAPAYEQSAASKVDEWGREGGTVTCALEAGTYYVTLVAVNTSGVSSIPSVEVAVDVAAPIITNGVKTYATFGEPEGLTVDDDGALWYDTSNGNALSRWDGATLQWVSQLIGTGALAPGSVDGNILAAAIAIVSQLIVESDSDGAIEVRNSDGTRSVLAADQTNLAGQATLESLITTGKVDIRGVLNALAGLLTLANGVSNPSAQLNVTADGYDTVTQSGGYGYGPRGMFWDAGESRFVYTDNLFLVGNVNQLNPTTGERTVIAAPDGHNGFGGVAKVGTRWYVLGQSADGDHDWWVFIYDASWNQVGKWQPVGATPDCWFAMNVDAAGTGLVIAKRTPAGNLFINPHTTAGVSSASATYPAWPGAKLSGILDAPVDTATARYVVVTDDGQLRVFNKSTGARVSGEEWPRNSAKLGGIGRDGTNLWTHDGSAVATRYSNLIGSVDAAYAWDLHGSGGGVVARTKASEARQFAAVKRARWAFTLPSAPPEGADGAIIYAAPHGGSLVAQGDLAGGDLSLTVASALATVGEAPRPSNEFAEGSGALGRIVSGALNPVTSNPRIDLNGDGAHRLDPTLNLDTIGDTAPLLLNAWIPSSAVADQAPVFRRIDGMVYVDGIAKGGAVGSPMFRFPEGCRPPKTINRGGIAEGAFCRYTIDADGYFTMISGSNVWASLGVAPFKAA